MVEPGDSFLYRLWFLIIAILVAANLILVALHLSTTAAISTSATTANTNTSGSSIAAAIHMNAVASKFGLGMDRTETVISSGGRFIGHTVQDSAVSAGRSAVSGMALMARVTSNIVESVTHPAIVSNLITPSAKTFVPVIDPPPALPAKQAVSQTVPQADTAVQWPIHGAITTQFGVPELPYERIHTGLDISDGRSPGSTPIVPFKPGRVAEIVRSSFGLGNHIVVDHGGGVTSIYGHLYSISVQAGQPVQDNTVLGYEGSTGASTGTHLHFEIRVNGQPENPQKFISGHP
jgi:murein DD-endopeptidase MepM/ murein hydrolase activator NlpD